MGRLRPLDFAVLKDPLTGVEAVLQRDRQRLDYCTEIGGKVVLRAERASDLERDTAKALRHGLGLSWRRVIVLERLRGVRHRTRAITREGVFSAAIVSFARGELAQRDDGELLFRGWPPEELAEDLPSGLIPEDERVVSLLDPRLGSEVVWRTYSDAAWKALEAAALVIARIGEALDTAESVDDVRRAVDLRGFFSAIEAEKRVKPQDFDPLL